MQVLLIAIGSTVALVVAVPVVYVVATLARTAVAAFRSRGGPQDAAGPAGEGEGFVDSLAWTLRWGEIADADEGPSSDSIGGAGPAGGP